MKIIPPIKIKKIIPASLGGLEAVILPVINEKETITLNSQLKLTISTRNRRIKKLVTALLVAHADMHAFTQEQEVLTEELMASNKALVSVNQELAFQNVEKEKRAAELIIANKELAFQNGEKEKRAAELIIANSELVFQNGEKEKRAAELIIANKELGFQNGEKEKRAAELIIANDELVFQNGEKEMRAAELIIANKELAFQNREKEFRAQEVTIANQELVFQNGEKEKRAYELSIANRELAYQNDEKEKRAAELLIANTELAFQNHEKEKRASELLVANEELAYQNDEKEKRAAELIVANYELAFQNNEKEKRAAELIVANHELAFQNEEKEKRAAELILVNKELEAFAYVASHDLQEPLRKIQTFSDRILKEEKSLSDTSRDYFTRMQQAGVRMRTLIEDLLAYSRVNATERKFEILDLTAVVEEAKMDLSDSIDEKRAVIEIGETCEMTVIPFQFRQLIFNLVGNALKFASPARAPHIIISSRIEGNFCHLKVADNGIGFESQYSNRIFEVFQKLHGQKEYAGTGIGLAIVKKIIENHNGTISASGELDKGATFDMYIPVG